MKKTENKKKIIILLVIFLLLCGTAVGVVFLVGKMIDPDSVPLVEKTISLTDIDYDYHSVGHSNLTIDKDNNGDLLSLYQDGNEVIHEKGYFAHAYSVIVFENLGTMGFTKLSTYIGVNKTARVNNTQTSIIFRILLDNKEIFASDTFTAYTNQQFVEVDVSGVDRITLIADSIAGNGNDHAVWADCELHYFNNIKPKLLTDDVEFAGSQSVTKYNILENARATTFDGNDISDQIEYSTNYKSGQSGEFWIKYQVNDGKATATKTVKMTVYEDKFVTNASKDYLTTPSPNFVYYGRSLLSKDSKKAYDLIMNTLLKVDIKDSSVTSITFDLQANGIYVCPNDVAKIKTYLIYDEPRLYYLYDWRSGYSAGISATTKNGFVGQITINLNNGTNGYYYGQSNIDAYLQAENSIGTFFANIKSDMTDAQMLYVAQNAYCPTITYANVNYADGFYGAFITKQCICSGYSNGFKYLAQRLGIRALYTNGSAGGAHAWNYIFVDGKWYMTDTTWGNANSFGLLGKDYMDSANRYDYGNFSTMPTLSATRYDLDLMKYNLMSVKDSYVIKKGTNIDLKDLVNIVGAVVDKAPVTKVEYNGDLNTNRAGFYNIEVTAQNSLGNIATGDCEIYVYSATDNLNSIIPTQEGNSNHSFREVSLYYGGNEKSFQNGLYTKANGTLSLTFDVSKNNYSYFSGYVGVDKVIRDNTPWGEYANATVNIYANGQLLFTKSAIKWKSDMTYFAVKLPDNTTSVKLEIIDSTGQGGIGWGDCQLYR